MRYYYITRNYEGEHVIKIFEHHERILICDNQNKAIICYWHEQHNTGKWEDWRKVEGIGLTSLKIYKSEGNWKITPISKAEAMMRILESNVLTK